MHEVYKNYPTSLKSQTVSGQGEIWTHIVWPQSWRCLNVLFCVTFTCLLCNCKEGNLCLKHELIYPNLKMLFKRWWVNMNMSYVMSYDICHMSKIVRLFSVHIQFSSVAQSCPTLRPHELQHARPPCPSSTPRVHSNSCPSSWWCHPAVSTSVVPFSSCPQSLPASESFPMSQLFTWDGQNIGVSALASVLLMNTPGLNTSNDHRGLISFRMGWLDLLAY